MKKIFIHFAILSLIFPLSSFASYSMDDLLNLCVKKRAIVKKQQFEVDKSYQEIVRSKGNFYPAIDTGYEFNLLDENEITEEDKDNNTFYAKASYNIFSGFKDIRELESLKKDFQIQKNRLEEFIFDIKLDASLCFLNVYTAKAELDVAKKAYDLYKKEHSNVNLKYKTGILKKNDLLKIKVEMDNAYQELLSKKNGLTKALNDLSLKTVTPLDYENLDFGYFEKLPVVMDLKFYTADLLKNRKDINALKALINKLEIEVGKSRYLFYPKADLALGYKFYDECEDRGQGDETRVTLNISLNIFDGFKKNAMIESASISVKQAQNALIDLESRLKTEIKNLLLDYDVSLENMKVAQASKKEAMENLRITTLAFEKGVMSSTDILDAIYYLSRARFNYINARADVFGKFFEISRMVETL